MDHKEKTIMRVCHCCLRLNESMQELQRCLHCSKSFLPLRYFEKIHSQKSAPWDTHFSSGKDLEDEDLIKGLFVLW